MKDDHASDGKSDIGKKPTGLTPGPDHADELTHRGNAHNPVWGPWATLIWGVLIGVVFVAVQGAVVSVYLNAATSDQADPGVYERAITDGDILSWATIASAVIGIILVAMAVALRRGSNFKQYLGLYPVDKIRVIKWTLLFVALLILLDLTTSYLDRPVTPDVMREIYSSADSKLLLFIGVVVAASVFEELFFRGFLMEGFRQTFLGPWGSVLVTAVFWSVVHIQYDLYGVATIFIIGLFLGLAKIKSGSTLFAMALHVLNNGIAFFFLALMSRMDV
ncbi:MAG: type II CAAX endopeptidase family protein [Cellvibrionaceae bacterium]